ncbi:MmgE/PrpD family protein [Methylovirgula sp. 4M-Z18]|uniref:MmgE/PrpD family protein n=1 Tax=Methylovirgula sp. 4M-Z18 TaxID=2293567 RepID=UPI000E2FB8EB|nr:MmgE/PrpD family protein [Methylovirgula sp. 4M-Z18]RFB79779.1 MmgE/PrpD family protein [Methylovirgula sp. 4M-Z18]
MQTADVTRQLARWIVDYPAASLPQPVRREGLRTVVNWLGCAIGGSPHETVDRALDAVRLFSGPAQATIFGRGREVDALHAALLNGIASHVLDYDDTHLKTIIHPAGPVASAAFAAAELMPINGADLLTAIILGIEAECRIGNCIYPDHYDRGWHITGTAGVFGAAAAVGRLLGLDSRKMTWALGIAATQSSGLREMFGTMCKSLHPGRAAQNGTMAAFLARSGFDSSERSIEAPRGFANVLSTKQDYGEILEGLGERWETSLNTYKPFACGIVIHPTIDGCQQIRTEIGDAVHRIAKVELTTHPLVLELTGKRTPKTGLEGKFSVYHSAAVALLHGDGTPSAFTDAIVADPAVIALRDRVMATADRAMPEESVRIVVTLDDGTVIERHIRRALGSVERPLSDAQLDEKFRGSSNPVLGEAVTDDVLATVWRLPTLPSINGLAALTIPARN